MNKFRKILIGAAIAAGVGCLAGGAAGCGSEPEYFNLTYEGIGLDYVFDGSLAAEDENGNMFASGDPVKEGVEVRFTLSVGSDTVGTPQILLNGEPLEPDENGVYSFIMERESKLTAEGLQLKQVMTFNSGDWHKFYDEDGELLNGDVSVIGGEEVRFKLVVSPYYKDSYKVTCDTEEIEPDADGYYSVTGGKATVNVENLEEDDDYIVRNDGDGTESNPYMIRRPIDLYTLAASVNDNYSSEDAMAYYKLAADIDMQGEKLFVIGDYSNDSAIFCGNFDGDGHTISNFYMTDEAIEQTNFTTEYLPYVGLFGFAAATTLYGPAVIKNVTLSDYEIQVHPSSLASEQQGSYAGSVLGYGIGVEIEGVKCVNGKIVSNNSGTKTSYMGGIAGALQSAYSDTASQTVSFDAYINGCSTDVELTGSGLVYVAGGIAGMIVTADTGAIAYVMNCVSEGRVYGAMYAGGIAGMMTRFSSIANCYSSSAVAAVNTLDSVGINASFRRAYAGGIVGYAQNDTVVSSSYAANASLSATAAAGNSFKGTGKIAGYTDAAGSDAVDSLAYVAYNCLGLSDEIADPFSSLGWAASEWDFSGAVPVYKGATSRSIKVTVKKSDNNVTLEECSRVIKTPAPICDWYAEGLSEYTEYSGLRSFGYYFDKELTQKAPYGYVPTASCVLYAGLADYSQAAGTYYIGDSAYGQSARLTLDEHGGAFFRDGGMSLLGTYSYDGNKITVYNTCLGSLLYSVDQTNGAYATVEIIKEDNSYSISGSIYITATESDGSTSSSLEPIALTAQKKSDGFSYGEYVNGNGNTLVLKENGTGTLTVNNNTASFTFTISEDGELTISSGLPVEVADGKVISFNRSSASLKDSFAGSWKTNANSLYDFTFDGAGAVTYKNVKGTYYEVAEGQALLTIGTDTYEAKFSSDGALFIDGIEYYKADGFNGSWYGKLAETGETVELTLGGVGLNGYGEAEITYYGGVTKSYVGQYSVNSRGLMRVYVEDMLYGELMLSGSGASGGFLSYEDYRTLGVANYVQSEFSLYDLFKGVWISDVEGITSVNFTGNGNQTDGGIALVTVASGRTNEYTYKLDTPETGVLTVDGNKYYLTLDELSGKISLTLGQDDAGGFARRDSWYGVTLYDENGLAYAFNGNGQLVGKVTVSGNGTESYDLAYTMGGDGLPVVDGDAVAISQTGFVWRDVNLSFDTGFEGVWVVPVSNTEITIAEVDSSLTAEVVMNGQTLKFNYDPAYNTLTYIQTDSKGAVTKTLFGLSGSKNNGYELSVSITGAQTGSYVCIVSGNEDDWAGTYTAADGSSWTFDGLGLSKYGSGTATYTSARGITSTYSYVQNSLGMLCIRTSYQTQAVFVETSGDGYSKSGKSYVPVTADLMYLSEVRYGTEYLVYDGAGTLWKNTDGVYEKFAAYTLLGTWTSTLRDFMVVEMDGVKYFANRVQQGVTYALTLSEYVEWTLSGGTDKYVIYDVNDDWVSNETGYVWLVGGDGYEMAYTYTKLSDAGRYGLTDDDDKLYIMTQNESDRTVTIVAREG